MLALRPHVSVCPGDGGPPPVAPLPPPPPPALHLNPLLALPPVRGVPDGAAGEGTSADRSDGVIISPASGYGKWPHALFTYAKMLIDDSFIYIFPQCQTHFSHCFTPYF